MEPYIDGFVVPVPRDRLDEYKRVAEAAAEIWKEHGAMEYWECVGDDLRIEGTSSFLDLANISDDETVLFSWAVFPSKQVRDRANEAIASDPRMAEIMDPQNTPFDMQRTIWGGFRTLVRATP